MQETNFPLIICCKKNLLFSLSLSFFEKYASFEKDEISLSLALFPKIEKLSSISLI